MIVLKKWNYQYSLFPKMGLVLERTTKGDKIFSTLYRTHYPKSKGIIGRQINYFIKKDGELLGIIGGSSPPLRYRKFSAYFDSQYTMLNWLNNNVFRLIVHEKNLGTQILKLFRQQIKIDYEEKYGDELVGLVTFVEPPRNGAIYRADNWTFLGMTQGRTCRRPGKEKQWSAGTQKLIFAIKLKKGR